MKNKPTNETDLSRPSVAVQVPIVKLTIQDLAFLRSLTQPKELRCHPGGKVLDKLRFLDLIARANIPPPKELIASVKAETADTESQLRAAVKACEWGKVSILAYALQNRSRELKPTEEDVLTDRGRELLKLGEVQVRVRKVGCVA